MRMYRAVLCCDLHCAEPPWFCLQCCCMFYAHNPLFLPCPAQTDRSSLNCVVGNTANYAPNGNQGTWLAVTCTNLYFPLCRASTVDPLLVAPPPGQVASPPSVYPPSPSFSSAGGVCDASWQYAVGQRREGCVTIAVMLPCILKGYTTTVLEVLYTEG